MKRFKRQGKGRLSAGWCTQHKAQQCAHSVCSSLCCGAWAEPTTSTGATKTRRGGGKGDRAAAAAGPAWLSGLGFAQSFSDFHIVRTKAPPGVGHSSSCSALQQAGVSKVTCQPVGPRHSCRQMTRPWPEITLNKQDVKNYWMWHKKTAGCDR